MRNDTFDRIDIALSLVLLLGLALPFLPLPGNAPAHIHVNFQAPGMAKPHAFTASTTLSDCEMLARALAYDHRDTGNFVRISCDD